MISPPNRGTEVVDFFKRSVSGRLLLFPAGRELGTGEDSALSRLKPVDIEVGVITGDRSINPLFSALIPGANDGMVSVENARLEEMSDFLVMAASHTFIMRNPSVIKQTIHFLKHGRFQHQAPPSESQPGT